MISFVSKNQATLTFSLAADCHHHPPQNERLCLENAHLVNPHPLRDRITVFCNFDTDTLLPPRAILPQEIAFIRRGAK